MAGHFGVEPANTSASYLSGIPRQLLVALELSEFNIDPNLIVKIVQDHWRGQKGFYAAIQNAQRRPNEDCLAFLSVRFMSASLGQRRVMQSATAISQRSAPHSVVPQFVWASGVSGASLLAASDAAALESQGLSIVSVYENCPLGQPGMLVHSSGPRLARAVLALVVHGAKRLP